MTGSGGRLLRRLERALLGAAMGAIAFVIERRVLRTLRSDAGAPAPRRVGETGRRG